MSADHASRSITIEIFLQAQPTPAVSFSDILLLVDVDTDDLGARILTINNPTEAAAAVVAGKITTGTKNILTTMFSQAPRLKRVKLGQVDTAASETWATGYAACVAADPAVYGVCMLSRTASDIAPLSNAIEAEGLRRLFVQSSLADWLTASQPASFAAITTNERTTVLYNSVDGAGHAEGYAAAYLAWNPDERSAPAALTVKGVTPPALTETQRNFVVGNNCNVGLAYGSSTFFVMDGVTLTGRPVYELTTADWLRSRAREALADVKVQRSALGLKVPVNPAGQELCLAPLRRLGAQGLQVGHFDDYSADGEEITIADTAAKRLRMTVRAQTQTDAIFFDLDVYLSRDPIAAEA